MKLAVEFDTSFYNEQIIYNLMMFYLNDANNFKFVLPQKKRCENTKTFEAMASQFGMKVIYDNEPEQISDGHVLITNQSYEITMY